MVWPAFRGAFIGIALMLSCLEMPARAEQPSALRLTQACSVTKGNTDILMATDGGISIRTGDLTIFTLPPKWDVTMVNTRARNFFQTDFNSGVKICANSRATVAAEFSGRDGWHRAQGQSIAGFATHEWSKAASSSKITTPAQKYWTASAFKAASQSAQLLTAVYGLPCIQNELPLKFVYFGTSQTLYPAVQRHYEEKAPDTMQKWLTTNSATKIASLKDVFAVPKGFKKSASFESVMVGNDIRKGDFIIKDLLKDPDALFKSR